MKEEAAIKRRFEQVCRKLNERSRRLVAASEALALGWGGICAVSRATGLSRKAISHGIKELREEEGEGEGRIRRTGGGRKSTVSKDASLREDLERLVEPATRGDPESPLRWTCKGVRKLAEELRKCGHQVSHELVSQVLHESGYSLQANRKTREGGDHPDRNAQFEHVNAQAEVFLAAGEPVDAKKKELVGDSATTTKAGLRCSANSIAIAIPLAVTCQMKRWRHSPLYGPFPRRVDLHYLSQGIVKLIPFFLDDS